MKKRNLRPAVLMASAVASLLIGAASAHSDGPSDVVQQMESHWARVIAEEDPARREALLAEHRELMAKGQQLLGNESMPMREGQHHDMHDDEHHMDLKNVIDMHRTMMQMMQ